MSDLREVIPANQIIGYLCGAVFMMFPLLAYRDATDLFGSGSRGMFTLSLITMLGGLLSGVAFANRGQRLLAVIPGIVAGFLVAAIWHWFLYGNAASSMPSGKLGIALAILAGGLAGYGLFWIFRSIRGDSDQ
jgi:hypothetical protein